MPKSKPKKTASSRSSVVPAAQRRSITSLTQYLEDESRAAARGEQSIARERFARRCGTTVQYLYQVAIGMRRTSPATAVKVEQATYGLVRVEDLCPDFPWDYVKIRDATRSRSRDSAPAAVSAPDSTALAA